MIFVYTLTLRGIETHGDHLNNTSLSCHFYQVKAYSKPPPLVETVMAAVMTLMGRGSDWATAKKALGEGNFLAQVVASSDAVFLTSIQSA